MSSAKSKVRASRAKFHKPRRAGHPRLARPGGEGPADTCGVRSRDEFFGPETVQNMGIAFSQVCKELGWRESDDPLNWIVARAIVKMAQSGIHDANDLTAAAIGAFRSLSPGSPAPRGRLSTWSAMDDFDLRNEIKIGRSTDKIAEALGRGEDEVRKRARKLGLRLPDER